MEHFNPLKYKHSCPSTDEEENYHFGDLGNIIANSEGKAFLSIIKKTSIKSLNGRLIIITNAPDKCKENNDSDKLSDVIAIGQLNVFKPATVEKTNGSQEYFLREINSVNKEEFEKKNNLITNNNANKMKRKENKKKENNTNKFTDNNNSKTLNFDKKIDEKNDKNKLNLEKKENNIFGDHYKVPSYNDLSSENKQEKGNLTNLFVNNKLK